MHSIARWKHFPWASAHRGKLGQLTPLENGWKIKKRKHAKRAVFWMGGGPQIYFRMYHFVVKFSKFSSLQAARGHWPPNQNPANALDIYVYYFTNAAKHTQTHTFNGPLSATTRVSRYQKGKTNLDFTGATDSEWQWHQLGHMQVFTSLQTDNHASTPPLSFLQAGCPSCRPTNSVKALKGSCS